MVRCRSRSPLCHAPALRQLVNMGAGSHRYIVQWPSQRRQTPFCRVPDALTCLMRMLATWQVGSRPAPPESGPTEQLIPVVTPCSLWLLVWCASG